MRIVAPIPKNPKFLKSGKIIKTQKLKSVQKYAKISNTPFNQRSLIHQEAWFPGGARIPQNPNCVKNRKNHQKRKKIKNVQKYAKISDSTFDQRSLISRKVLFPPCFVRQYQAQKTFFLFGKFRPLPNINVQI